MNNMVNSKDLTFEYIRRDENGNVESITKAVDGVNIHVEPGQFVAILGHNGSGKSTFAKHINALLSPTEGSLFIDKKDTKNRLFKFFSFSFATRLFVTVVMNR